MCMKNCMANVLSKTFRTKFCLGIGLKQLHISVTLLLEPVFEGGKPYLE